LDADTPLSRVRIARRNTLKTLLRKADERSIAAVWHRIGELLGLFAPEECANYIRHAGYDRT